MLVIMVPAGAHENAAEDAVAVNAWEKRGAAGVK